MPLMIQGHDKTFDDNIYALWPPAPWFVKLLLKWLLVPKHKDWWYFAPCDVDGKPRELPFAV